MARVLNPQQRAFCNAYVKTSNATSAAVSAGYSAATAAVQGCQMLKKPLIAAEIARLRSKIEKKTDLTAELVLQELCNLIVSNPQELFDEHGNLKPIQELPAGVAKTISSIEMSDKGSGIKKLKQHNKLGAIELAAKLLGLVRQEQNSQQAVTIVLAPAVEIAPRQETSHLLPAWED